MKLPDEFTKRQHSNADLHLIGEALPSPSSVSSLGISSIGTSPFPARSDHRHGIDVATSAPTALGAGHLWFDTTSGKLRLKVYTGAAWKIVGGDMPHFQVHESGTISVNNVTATCPSWDTEDYDSENSISVPVTGITIPAGFGGIYNFSYSILADNDTAAVYTRAAWIDVNVADGSAPTTNTGRRYGYSSLKGSTAGDGYIALTGSAPIKVSAGDVVRVKCWQNSGGNKTWGIANNKDLNHFSGVMVSHVP